MRQDDRSATYQAFLLRLWREGVHSSWRASLYTATEKVYHFATADALLAFLDQQMAEDDHPCAIELERSDA